MLAKKIIFGLAAILLISISVKAETLTGDFSISYCQDAPIEKTMIFKNTDAGAKTFSLDIQGTKTPWSYVTPTKETIQGFCASSQDIVLCTAPSEFSIAGNAQREIYFFSKAKAFATPGTYLIDVLSGNGKIGAFTVTAQQCHTLGISAVPESATVGQCEAKTFALTVSNTGNFTEEISLQVSEIPSEWVSMQETDFILNQGAKKTVNASVQAPCSQALGKYDFEATAGSARANVSATQKLSLSIENKQGISILDIEGGNTINSCKEQETSETIKVTNNGRLADEIELSINAASWITLSKKTLSIPAGESRTTELVVGKTSAEEKEYAVEITAKSTKFENSAAKTITVNLSDCYNAQIEKVSGAEKACLTDKPEFEFRLQNNKAKTITLSLKTSGVNARPDKTSVSLEPGQSATVKATIDASTEQAGKKELVLEATSNYFTASSKNAIELVKCSLEIMPEKNIVDVNASVGAITRITVLNNTLTTENVKVSVRGKEWILFQPKEFSMAPGEKKEVYVFVSPPYYSEDSTQKAEIIARSDKYAATKGIDLKIFGGTQLGKADILLRDQKIIETATTKEIIVTVSLKNDSNVSVTVKDINSQKFSVSYVLKNNKILPNESNPADITIRLAKGFDENRFSVPLNIFTEQGMFDRFILIDLNPRRATDQNAATQTLPIGLASLFKPRNILTIVILVVLIAALVYLLGKSKKTGTEEESTETSEESEETETGIESLEEQIKAKPKRKKKKRR